MSVQKYVPFLIGILLLLTGVLYLDGLVTPFVMDDFAGIVWRTSLQDSSLLAIWRDIPNRFVSLVIFSALLKNIGVTPVPFHVFALLLHLVCTLVVYGIVYKTVVTLRQQEPNVDRPLAVRAEFPALFAAALFAWHPLQSQVVLYAWQGATALATLCTLASIWFYLRTITNPSTSRTSKILSLTFMLLGGFSKPIAVLVPAYLLALKVCIEPQKKLRAFVVDLLPWLAVAMVIAVPNLFIESQEMRDIRLAKEAGNLLHPLEYLQTQFYVLGKYLSLVAWPRGLSIDHFVDPVRQVWDPRFLLSAMLHLTLVIAAVLLRKRMPLVTIGVAVFYGGHLVESSLLPLEDLMFEHRMYAPMLGIGFVAAGLLVQVLSLRPTSKVIASVLLACIILAPIALAFRTASRIVVWKSRETLWQDAAENAPQKRRAWTNYGMAQLIAGKYEQAVETLKYAANLPGKQDSRLFDGLGNAYVGLGDDESAEANFRQALTINPNDGFAWKSYGVFLANEKRFEEAVAAFQKALSIHPNDVHVQKMLGEAQHSSQP